MLSYAVDNPEKCPFPWGSWFLGPTHVTEVFIRNGISIGSTVFAQLTVECPCPYTL